MKKLLRRGFFSYFPQGPPGAGLLVLRTALGAAMLIQGWMCPRDPAGWLALAAGALLLTGLYTPLAGAAAGLGGPAAALCLPTACAATLFDSRLAAAFAGAVAVAVILLGPGAFSIDARLFGRREIIIPVPPAKSAGDASSSR